MYKGHSIWDEEQERQEEKYTDTPDREGNKAEYHQQEDYASGKADQSDVYNAGKGEEEKKDKEAKGIEKDVLKEDKKYEKKEASEEDIKRKAASEVHDESKKGDIPKKKKEHKTIEDAINKAMKEEKELIYMGD